MTDEAPADNTNASVKRCFEEETTERIARADKLFYALNVAADGGGGVGDSQDKAAVGTFRIGPYDQ